MAFQPKVYRWSPAWPIETVKFFPRSGALISASPYTGTVRAAATANSPWVVSMTLSLMGDEAWKPVRSQLLKLRGPTNWIRLFDPASIMPRGTAAGINAGNFKTPGNGQWSDSTLFSDGTGWRDGGTTAQVARTHQRGESILAITGLVASQALSLASGDMLEVGGYLHCVVDDAGSDSSGNATVAIEPPLRKDIGIGTTDGIINFAYPTSPFVMANRDYDGFDVNPPILAQIGLSFIEVLPL